MTCTLPVPSHMLWTDTIYSPRLPGGSVKVQMVPIETAYADVVKMEEWARSTERTQEELVLWIEHVIASPCICHVSDHEKRSGRKRKGMPLEEARRLVLAEIAKHQLLVYTRPDA